MKVLPKVMFALTVVLLFSITVFLWPGYGYKPQRDIRGAMQIIVTFSIGAAAVFVILAKRYGPKDKHWAYATLGTILGYWLKG
jgi:hypothetical protein